MDEVTKALGPWPILQLVFGLVVLGLGVWSIIRGLKGKDGVPSHEDQRAEWAAYEQLRNIEENSFKMVALLEKLTDAVNRLSGVLWNHRQ